MNWVRARLSGDGVPVSELRLPRNPFAGTLAQQDSLTMDLVERYVEDQCELVEGLASGRPITLWQAAPGEPFIRRGRCYCGSSIALELLWPSTKRWVFHHDELSLVCTDGWLLPRHPPPSGAADVAAWKLMREAVAQYHAWNQPERVIGWDPAAPGADRTVRVE